LSLQKVKAVFISHEHSDHIRGLAVLSKKYRIPVYITAPTYRNGKLHLDSGLMRTFSSNEVVVIGGLAINAFPKLHDACDPYSFMIVNEGVRVGVFTDIGEPCEQLIRHFRQCHAAFLESNYDEEMLENGGYPYYLKKRIRGGLGHLSNKQALELFLAHKPSYMSHLLLSHLSKNNNCPNLVQQLFNGHAGSVQVIVASRYEESAVYNILAPDPEVMTVQPQPKPQQLSFSFV
jgi:phosphoribosyl 1,2-cyclic phosphodiesterase